MNEFSGIEKRAFRLWSDIGGINEFFLEELEAEAEKIAAKAAKLRRGVKYGAVVTGLASISAALAIILLRPKLAQARLRRAG
ncbi:MAG: hypothetical protein FWC73_08170 [Defluviitaleaceae bacterium]|nr:hypothetical protein [Defluviitaleaceae bacterium]